MLRLHCSPPQNENAGWRSAVRFRLTGVLVSYRRVGSEVRFLNFHFYMVRVAQLAEHRIVAPSVGDSSSLLHPKYGGVLKWLKRLVLKTKRSVLSRRVGSNPTASAKEAGAR